MMKTEKALVNVNKGQDAYSVIGNYISNHITAIEDMIAVIQINGCITNELYMVDIKADGCFYWKSDWWEGEEDVALIDFFSVSEAERPQEWIPCKERLPEVARSVLFSRRSMATREGCLQADGKWWQYRWNEILNADQVIAWKPLSEPYREDVK